MRAALWSFGTLFAYFLYVLPATKLANVFNRPEKLSETTRQIMSEFFPTLDLLRVGVTANATLPWPKAKRGITQGGSIYVRGPFAQTSHRDLRLLMHELVHVGQYARLGTIRFLWVYGQGKLKGGYRENPLEKEAFSFVHENRDRLKQRAVALGLSADTSPSD
jgi:Domain of unknown function (DUF4157)